ncbi:MAG TPA: baseplate J/gp47 family protein [Nevskia sp.]|nr:baseplate J/gp47 family protein [Nevskia sp.]
MSDTEPTLAEINSRADAALVARLTGSAPQLPRGIIPGIKRALVGAVKALFGRLDTLFQQSTPYGATKDDSLRWSSIWNKTPRDATAANGTGTATGVDTSPIPAGTMLQDAVGNSYTVTADAAIAGTTATISLLASTPGAAGNQEAGAQLTFVNPPAGVAAAVALPEGLAGGTDKETWQQVKVRALERIQNPPQGGSKEDYRVWALTTPGLTRAWVFPLYSGRGTVRVYVVDDNYAGPGLASAAEVSTCQTYIDSVRPAGAAIISGGVPVSGVTVMAPIATPVDFTISGVPSAQRAAVQAALQALFFNAVPEGSMGRQAEILAIGEASGISTFNMSAPAADQNAAAGHLLTLGTITWL